MSKELTIFDVLNTITNNIDLSEDEVIDSGFNIPMLIEFLTKKNTTLFLASFLRDELLKGNSIYVDNPYLAYMLCKGLVPKVNIRWIKSEKPNNINMDDRLISFVLNEYMIGKDEAIDYILNDLPKEELERIWSKNTNDKFPSRFVNTVLKNREK